MKKFLELVAEKKKAMKMLLNNSKSEKKYRVCNNCKKEIPNNDNICQNCQLIEKADRLVGAANVFAVGSFVPTLDHFPILSKVNPRHWDFILSVAGVFIVATILNGLQLDNDQGDTLMDIVEKKLSEWDTDGTRAFDDCKSLFEKEYDRLAVSPEYQKDRQFISVDALGIWIVWNLFNRQPQNNEEISLVRVTGSLVMHTFHNWWKLS